MDILAGKECSAAGDGEQCVEDITEFPPAQYFAYCKKMMFGRWQLRFIIQTYFSAARILRNRFAYGKAGRTAKTVIGVKQRLRSPHNYALPILSRRPHQ